MRNLYISGFIILNFCLCSSAFGQPQNADMPQAMQDYFEEFFETFFGSTVPVASGVIAKAEPDECYYGLGNTDNTYDPDGFDCEECEEDGGQGKVNQAYIWAMSKDEYNIWFGTGPNIQCLVMGTFFGDLFGSFETPSFVCEFGDTEFPDAPAEDGLGDWRPFQVYSYNTHDGVLTEYTDEIETNAPLLWENTLGVRGLGVHNDVVIFGGPTLDGSGINLFALEASTGDFLGAENLMDYTNIRKFLVVQGVLYTAVGTADDGHVLRWNGNKTDPFDFEIVGNLGSDGAELAYHDGRIFVSTWPSDIGADLATLYMSPIVPGGGLTNAHADSWTAVWNVADYEPDPVTAATYGGGALISYGGYLWWGTMHVPFISSFAHFLIYGDSFGANGVPDELDYLFGLLGPYRAISIFRGKNFGQGTQSIQLAYGMPYLPAYLPPVPGFGEWQIVPNNMNQSPLFGFAGLNNPFNNYTWSMAVCENTLYIGTMDWSYLLLGDLVNSVFSPQNMAIDLAGMMGGSAQSQQMMNASMESLIESFDPNMFFGADLFCFPDPDKGADVVSRNGMGNPTSYGIRNMCATDDYLYLGMANPMNLLTCSNTSPGQGGWELVSMLCPNKIPTLSQWGLILLCLILTVLGTVFIRRRILAS